MPARKLLYFGPPNGFYKRENFEYFARLTVPDELKKIKKPSICNQEIHSQSSITFHFPDAGIRLHYMKTCEDRCVVHIMSTRHETQNSIEDFIYKEEQITTFKNHFYLTIKH